MVHVLYEGIVDVVHVVVLHDVSTCIYGIPITTHSFNTSPQGQPGEQSVGDVIPLACST